MTYEDLAQLVANVSPDVLEQMKKNSDILKACKEAGFDVSGSGAQQVMSESSKTSKSERKTASNKYHAVRNHPEKNLEQFVHDKARTFGLLYYHTYRSRYSEPGFPDCIIMGRYTLIVELKDTGRNPTPAQHKWLLAFGALGFVVKVWRPEDKDEIVATLAAMRVV